MCVRRQAVSGADVRVDQLSLAAHQQVFVVDQGEPLHQEALLLLVWNTEGRDELPWPPGPVDLPVGGRMSYPGPPDQ